MILTKEVLNSERLQMDDIITKTYGQDSQEYRDMMFALNLYYQGIIRYLEK